MFCQNLQRVRFFLTQKALEDRIGSYTHTHTSLGNRNLLTVSDLTHAIERRN